jgi:hypothetical protein
MRSKKGESEIVDWGRHAMPRPYLGYCSANFFKF